MLIMNKNRITKKKKMVATVFQNFESNETKLPSSSFLAQHKFDYFRRRVNK